MSIDLGTANVDAAVTLRDRLVDAATAVTTTEGWSSVTMARLAEAVGVSRQTVYNEIGTKPALAEAMILRELARFLEAADRAFLAHPDDFFAALGETVTGVLEFAEGNELLKAIVSATHGADTELLPLLTTHSATLLETAKIIIGEHIAAYELGVEDHRLAGLTETIIRVVLSHVMQPGSSPDDVADTLVWMARRILDPDASTAG
ncbi:TetR/AcrR family transcriptional regulator [Nocardioides jiangxiensis]|uniref:TetR family transcriptional regulator n=1 Tax=Nocardioides jiangxiensis TaxID=3064524 RepID=A0ABT9B0B7_9ACTN|nr:TetR family transcriptional regulator [Nocardioides sp. WY-20]MDO7868287.1 TetR family transcriptional regulator [Nocardioides sp. WY-20]